MAMKCPVCSVLMTRVKYSGRPVFQCERCRGHATTEDRLAVILRSAERSVRELKEEVLSAAGTPDSEGRLRCPKCRMPMEKEFREDPALLHVDCCGRCSLVWLDAGELARCQLARRMDPQMQEALEMQRRYREMSPERRQALEEAIEKLPEPENPVAGGLREGFVGGLLRMFLRGRW
jgi:Zn-finger nucleic acid-binding protein